MQERVGAREAQFLEVRISGQPDEWRGAIVVKGHFDFWTGLE